MFADSHNDIFMKYKDRNSIARYLMANKQSLKKLACAYFSYNNIMNSENIVIDILDKFNIAKEYSYIVSAIENAWFLTPHNIDRIIELPLRETCKLFRKKGIQTIQYQVVTLMTTNGQAPFITEFLYFIGSVFAPMIAIQIADFFILKQNKESSAFNIQNLIIWLAGFIIYRLLMKVDIFIGNTLPDMLITIVSCMAVSKVRSKIKKALKK